MKTFFLKLYKLLLKVHQTVNFFFFFFFFFASNKKEASKKKKKNSELMKRDKSFQLNN